MDSIGAEVGQKMRSAIKAKLLELSCYVDDELPDYIMVMVANKRTKSQMNEDLNLFLSTKTSTFVDWLHIVLKKLKEVTVTNPEVYKKVTKRKLPDVSSAKVKKEKKDISLMKEKKEQVVSLEMEQNNSLTDNLLVDANKLSEQRKITIMDNNSNNNDDVFDIPLLSQVDNLSTEKDLQVIERKIRSVKNRLGLLVDSDIEEELPEIKTEKVKLEFRNKLKKVQNFRTILLESQFEGDNGNVNNEKGRNELATDTSKISMNTSSEMKTGHKRITFEEEGPPRKLSVLERLGSRPNNPSNTSSRKSRISLSEFRKEDEPFLKYSNERRNEEKLREWRKRIEHASDRSKRDSPDERKRDRSRDRRRVRSSEGKFNRKEGILSRLGVMSKVSIPPREPEEPEPEDELKTREVRSVVQVKPRVIPSGTPQPNKNLLLKAVAEAQRSIAQTLHLGLHMKLNSLNMESSRDTQKSTEEAPTMRKFSQKEKNKLKDLILSHTTQDKCYGNEENKREEEYIPKPLKETPRETFKYVPTSVVSEDLSTEQIEQQFIITLDGADKKFNNELKPSIKDRLDTKISPAKVPVKMRLDKKRSPSPIIFDMVSKKVNSKTSIPDKLPIVHPPLSVKNKERCKYWPNCRQGDKCEFVHPSNPCEMFPHCKFGDKCLYIHPTCKFGSACTKRDCPYSHSASVKLMPRIIPSGIPVKAAVSGLQTCKFFPNCSNSNCQFYHPKPCKFGKYCKNQSECNFSHHYVLNKSSLTWRSK